MDAFIEKTKLVWNDKTLRKRILFVLGALIVFRLLAAIPIPGINATQLQALFANNQFLGLLNVFSGGGLSTLSIIMLGVSPYITSSIIMQLLTMMSSKLKDMYQNDGEAGRKKFAQYSRLITVPLALIQGFGFIILFEKEGILNHLSTFAIVTNVIVIVAGSILLMWMESLSLNLESETEYPSSSLPESFPDCLRMSASFSLPTMHHNFLSILPFLSPQHSLSMEW